MVLRGFICLLAAFVLTACSTYIKIPVVASMPQGFMQMMKGGKKIAIIAAKSPDGAEYSDFGDMTTAIQGAAENAFRDYRYFEMVDIAGRRDRLREIAFTQSGMTAEQREIGQEFAVNGFLYLEVPAPPQADCRMSTRTKQVEECVARDEKGKCTRNYFRTVIISTATLTMRVSVKGRLVNLETGQMMTHLASNIGAARLETDSALLNALNSVRGNSTGQYVNESEGGIASCPSVLTSFQDAVGIAAQDLVMHLSPKIVDYNVVIEDDIAGTPDSAKDAVKGLLKAAIKWLKSDSPNFEEAFENWKQAFDLSGGQSLSALWNLAIYYWATGDLAQADQYFTKVKINPDFFDDKKMEIYSTFKAEKKRRDMEASAYLLRWIPYNEAFAVLRSIGNLF